MPLHSMAGLRPALFFLCIGILLGSAAAADDPAGLRMPDLETIPALAAPVRPAKATLSGFAAEISRVSGSGIIILGRVSLDAKALQDLQGKPARAVMRAVAGAVGGEWVEHGRFYLLFPAKMARHGARPVSLARRYPEFRRKLSGVIIDDLMGTVLEAGARTRVALHVVGPGAAPEAQSRATLPCISALPEVTLDELMGALTVLTGDPWHHHHNVHLLCFTGRTLTEAELQQIRPILTRMAFTGSLTGDQRRQMLTAEGLPAARLSPDQRWNLEVVTQRMRQASGVPVESLVLRGTPPTERLPNPEIEVYAAGPAGLVHLGSM